MEFFANILTILCAWTDLLVKFFSVLIIASNYTAAGIVDDVKQCISCDLNHTNDTNNIDTSDSRANISVIKRLRDGALSMSQICYDELGCFGRNDFFHARYRPVSLLPDSPENINVAFTLYTNGTKFKGEKFHYTLNKTQLLNSAFDHKKMTKFIIHGFTQEFKDLGWMGKLKDVLLRSKPDHFNVFAVDWSNGSQTTLYSQAVANTRVVGAVVGNFVGQIINTTHASPKNFHLIGHSLGGHIVSYAGKILKKVYNIRIGRITALDPAGPSFQMDNPDARIDRLDADYVEALHTNGGNSIKDGFGLARTVADYDFYPNGGESMPGCGASILFKKFIQEGPLSSITSQSSCSHNYACDMSTVDFDDHISERCQHIGYKCEDYKAFESGKCGECDRDNNQCAIYDLFAAEIRNDSRFVRQTLRKLPMAKLQGTDDFISSAGTLKMSIIGSKRSEYRTEIIKSEQTGLTFTILKTYELELGQIKEIDISFEPRRAILLFNILKLLQPSNHKVSMIETFFMSNIDPDYRLERSSVLCPQTDGALDKDRVTKFILCPHESQPSPH